MYLIYSFAMTSLGHNQLMMFHEAKLLIKSTNIFQSYSSQYALSFVRLNLLIYGTSIVILRICYEQTNERTNNEGRTSERTLEPMTS